MCVDRSSPGPPPRKKPRISVLKRNVHEFYFDTTNETFQIPKKSVRFDIPDKEQQKIHNVPKSLVTARCTCPRIISNEEIKNRWYNRSDLTIFRQEAISDAFFKLNKSHGDETSLPRGMESLSPIRRKHKTNTLRYVLLAHRIGKDQNYVGRLCSKLGRWNRDIAIRDAFLDYLEIYQPSSMHNVLPVMSKPPNIPIVPDSVAKAAAWSRSRHNKNSVSAIPSLKKRAHT
eukprot:CAMPEP_0116129754 /NCGR_PEP_ID=MMETSP0329-20121206/8087_1 /TAXON_ID=697910 /ORGANISM="Pseudo-nitzschia arenysensis, Strain B593" /LENGTH=229 /DNA_ID=CAMNT_0003624031 /DNA_START=130 /DNA_END=819 /DNA_ORIENTATION=-